MKVKLKLLFCKMCPTIGLALLDENGELTRLTSNKCHNQWNDGPPSEVDIPVPSIDVLADLICEAAPLSWAAGQNMEAAQAWERKAHKALHFHHDGGRAKVVEKAIELARKIKSSGKEFPEPQDEDFGDELEALVDAVGELK